MGTLDFLSNHLSIRDIVDDSLGEDPPIQKLNLSLPDVEQFDKELLPNSLQGWVVDVHERVQCPMDYLAVGVMIGLAGLVGRKVGIHPKQYDDWLVIPNLWGALVGRPSTMKTAALNEVLSPVYEIESREKEQYLLKQREYKVNSWTHEAQLKNIEAQMKKATRVNGLSDEDLLIIKNTYSKYIQQKDENPPPTLKRVVVNDVTVEALGERLNENSNGLILFRDELTGWIKSQDKEDKANDRSFYLECFNGSGSYIFDRIGRGTVEVQSTTLSIVGGIQPSKLEHYVNQAISMGIGDDGFLQRFQLLVFPDCSNTWENVDRTPDKAAKDLAWNVYETMHSMLPKRTDDNKVVGLRFSLDAQALFDEWRAALEAEVRQNDIHPAVESHLVKYRSLIPTLALILNLADEPEAKEVSKEYLMKAIKWGEYLKSHSLRLYGGFLDQSVINAELIFNRRSKLKSKFNVRDVRNKGWGGLTSTPQIKEAILVLLEHNYLIEEELSNGGRPTISYRWNRRLLVGE